MSPICFPASRTFTSLTSRPAPTWAASRSRSDLQLQLLLARGGLGLRYKTPVGPIRVDFSYNLNPPVYPVIYDFNGAAPYEGQAPHFNFFFSIGQAF